MQLAPVDTDFRICVTGELAAGLLVEQLAETVEEAALPILDARRDDGVLHPQRGELAHRVRQQRDAHPQFPDFGRGFIHMAGNPPPMQIERETQPPYASARDGNFHAIPSTLAGQK